ncbi:Cell division cycle protein 16 [Phytophthora nicotianae]|uniref:Cell division cycle protein 16 n=1 Tax=Phytophthora nicotianae TaxID=4792 RepID=A0A0W8BWB5_PHYNI|nr:Cell division cycle protein 16 [Phytophthora nicotianae]
MAPPPPTPCRPPAPSIHGSSWRQPSPVQTPDCTTRTLAFDSAASSAADEASARAKKRRRRVDQAAAFITARRPLDTDQDTDQDEEQDEVSKDAESMWTLKSGEDAVRHPTHSGGHLEDNKPATKPPLTNRKTSTSVQKDSRQITVDRLRQLVKICSAQHHAASALFYADKLVSMSPSNDNDVLLFADACYLNREFHRAIHTIKKARLTDVEAVKGITVPSHVTLRAFLLLGRCMLAIKQKEECLELLGSVLPDREHDVVLFAKKVQQVNAGDDYAEVINVVSSLALLMGETFEAIGNRENATVYFRIALRCDVHCSEAFFHLFDKQMLSAQEEKELVASLDFSVDEMQLLELLYQTHVGKYDTTTPVEERFAEVEQEFGLADNLELNITRAETYYYQHDIQLAHEICESVRERDPFNFRVISVYVGTLVELGKKRELYHYAHQMKYEAAQRYFHVYYKEKDYPQAIEMFTKALQLCKGLPERLMEAWEPTLFNLGYSYRKLRKFDQAIHYFQSALRLSPRNSSILAALGFTYHMKGNLEQAIESYHAALAYAPEDTLAGSMITIAFEESLSGGPGSFPEFAEPPPKNAPKTSGLTPLRARRSTGNDSNLRRLDQSYSSIERSRQSLACSSLNFSDDSSMMNVDED